MKYVSLLMLSLLMACGGGGSKGGSSEQTTVTHQEALETDRGTYLATLRPINTHLSGFLPSGQIEVKLVDGNLRIKSVLDDDARVIHWQNIHLGERCPTSADDANGDGFVDVNEARKVTGRIIIPLDSDLEDQISGVYPAGSGMTYTKSVEVSRLLDDLHDITENPGEWYEKLDADETFGLQGRVVLIHGASLGAKIPATVTSVDGASSQVSIPIACGILSKIE